LGTNRGYRYRMSAHPFSIKLLDLPIVTEGQLVALHELQNTVNAERFPADPPMPYEMRRRSWRTSGTCWAALSALDGLPIANVWIGVPQTAAEQHLIEFDLLVLPTYRQQSIGRHLLAVVANIAATEHRDLLLTQTNSHVPSGACFMQQIGARSSLASRTLQLDMTTFDHALLDTWTTHAQEHLTSFKLEFCAGAYPETDLVQLAKLNEAHNDSPHRSITIGHTIITPELLRQREHEMDTHGQTRWTMYVREQITGEIVGFSEVSWHKHTPEQVEQGVTGVLPAYRKRGIGHWVKAALLSKLARHLPEARFVRTGNPLSNTAMLGVNYDLGFKTISEDVWWELRLEQVRHYLESRASSVANQSDKRGLS
jgi:mycothiol synthase